MRATVVSARFQAWVCTSHSPLWRALHVWWNGCFSWGSLLVPAEWEMLSGRGQCPLMRVPNHSSAEEPRCTCCLSLIIKGSFGKKHATCLLCVEGGWEHLFLFLLLFSFVARQKELKHEYRVLKDQCGALIWSNYLVASTLNFSGILNYMLTCALEFKGV